ncbi:DUF6603 domain-containing protein [Blautia producta]|uniref:DUF6603 domain-containing protein n=1 Tax=Blautia producta TaxID=33035 RepID=UPI0035BE7F9D
MNWMEYTAALKNNPASFLREEAEALAFEVEEISQFDIPGYVLKTKETETDFTLTDYMSRNRIEIPSLTLLLELFPNRGIDEGGYTFTFYPDCRVYREYVSVAASEDEYELIPGFLSLAKTRAYVIKSGDAWSGGMAGEVSVDDFVLNISLAFMGKEAKCAVSAAEKGFPGFVQLIGWLAGKSLSEDAEKNIEAAVEKLFDFSVTVVGFTLNLEEKKLVGAELEGMLTLGPFSIRAGGTLPDMRLWGNLEQENPLSVKEILECFGVGGAEIFGELFLTQGSYDGNFETGVHAVKAEVSGALTFGAVCLTKLGFSVRWDPKGGTDFAVYGAITVSETLAIEAEVQAGGSGFTVSGAMQVKEEEGEGFWSYLAKTFGISNLPDWLTALELQGVSILYDSGEKKYEFELNGTLRVSEDCVLAIFVGIKGGQDALEITGSICAAGRLFTVCYEDGKIQAVYENKDGEVFDVRELAAGISKDAAKYVPNLRVICKRIELSIQMEGKDKGAAFSAVMGGFEFTGLPVAGPMFPAGCGLSQITVAYHSDKGVALGGIVCLGEKQEEFSLSVGEGRQRKAVAAQAPETSSTMVWLKLDKTLAVITLHRIGLGLDGEYLMLVFDASLNVSPLTFTLYGAGAGVNLKDFDVKFSITGFGVQFKNSVLSISGGLNYTGNSYAGSLLIQIKEISVFAVAEYSEDGSLFAYAVISGRIGGPPAFFVTGIALGFAYNKRIETPAIDEVQNFPLVRGAMGQIDKKDMLSELSGVIKEEKGQKFLAAGVKFTTFEIVQSFVLLTVSFGNTFVINLLGLSDITMPPDCPASVSPIAHAQLALKASIKPSEGFFGLEARLTSESYILSRDCHLTGGFAFYMWFAGEHSGDFVITLGGYHPKYQKEKPAHYPEVPRLGFNWKIGSCVNIDGDIYFALTPCAIMAGGRLSATYSLGPLKAYFVAKADFYLAWKPFCYDAEIGIVLGASLRVKVLFVSVTLKLELGAMLHIWGPDFSGAARISLWIFSFNVTFGANAAQGAAEIEWEEFCGAFLPKSS